MNMVFLMPEYDADSYAVCLGMMLILMPGCDGDSFAIDVNRFLRLFFMYSMTISMCP